MVSRLAIHAILFFLPACLYSQSPCPGLTFSGTKEVSLNNNVTETGLIRQPDGSFDGVTIELTSFQLGALYSNYQNVILTGCAAAATPITTVPALPDNPPALGVGSQILAIADFQKIGIPSAVFTPSDTPAPQIDFGGFSAVSGVSLTTYVASSTVASLAAGDFNNDGNYDFVAVVSGGGTAASPGGVEIFLGNGAGAFKTGASYVTGIDAKSVTVADVNSDGNLDLVVCSTGTSAISVLLGNGDGTFHATAATPTAGAGPQSVIAADFNNDKKLDLGVSNGDGTVSIFLGNGDGSFQTAMSFSCGTFCSFLAAGEFNGDGNLDLAVSNLTNNVVAVLIGNGEGTFGAPTFYAGGAYPASLILTDFNNDGKLDIVVGTGTPDYIGPNSTSNNVDLLLGNGDGTFQGTQPLPTGGKAARALAIADLNGDGKPDIIVANENSANLTAFLGQGNGEFQTEPPYTLSSGANPVSVAAADFNGDGKIDVATVEENQQSLAISLGNGDGTFQAPSVLAAGTTPFMVAAGDLNGDGKPDLVVADDGAELNPCSPDAGSVLVFLNSGSGFLPVKTFPAGAHPTAVAIEDVNLDGKPDLVVSDFGLLDGTNTGGVSVLLGNGDGTFGAPLTYTAGQYSGWIASADVNGDGKPDVILPVLAPSGYEVLVFLGKGDGTFLAPSALKASEPDSNLIVGDFNGDGKPDLILSSCCSGNSMAYFLGNGDGTFQPQTLFNGDASPAFVASADFNNDGKPDLAIANELTSGGLTILLNTTPAPPTNMTANSGTTPQSAAAGSAFANALAVTVTNSSNEPVAGLSVTFTAPSSGASGTFAGGATTFTTTTNASGVATAAAFTANATAGSYNVTATAEGLSTVSFALTNTATGHPAFFSGEVLLGGGIYYLQFANGNLFGYYGYLSSSILYHQDLGYEGFIPSTGGQIYFYDFTSGHWWYTSSTLFPYLYDFTLNSFIYYFPNTTSPGHYTSNPRYFVNLTTQKIFTM